ncbi:MAG TPA: YceI family protein [Euzebyales bacterium]|nr:YceI family protein [Euzebyales bacterium]
MSAAVLAPTAVPPPGRHTTGRWQIDARHTAVTTRVRVLGVPLQGRFAAAEGVIDVPDDITRSQVSVTVRSDSFETGIASHTRFAHGRHFLDAAEHPTLTFSGDRLRPILESLVTAGGDRPLWWLEGELTALGVTRPLRIALGVVRHRDDGEALEFHATATVRRSDFGVVSLGPLIADTVELRISGLARRTPAIA